MEQNNYQPQQNQQPNQQQPADGKAIASLVLGIVALVTVFFGYGALLGLVLSIVGLILGINSRKSTPSGMATAGVVLNIIALVLCALTFIACVACVGALASIGASY